MVNYGITQGGTVTGDLTVTGELTAAGGLLPEGDFNPQDHGYEAWTGDPENITSAAPLTSGTLYLRKLLIRRAFTPTTLAFSISVVAQTITAGENFAGLYDSSGNLLDSVGIDTEIASSGVTEVALSPGALDAETFVWAAVVVNATTEPQLHRMTSTSTPPNANLDAAVLRSAVNGTLLTALPATITPADNSGTSAFTLWFALR